MKHRKLTAADVEFTVSLQQEVESVHGHYATGEDALDRKLEADIIAALDAGYVESWCCIKVTASWEGIEGHDYLGCCSHLIAEGQPSLAEQVEQTVEYHAMRDEALAALNATVSEMARKLDPLTVAEDEDDSPMCNCGTCTPGDYTCVRDD